MTKIDGFEFRGVSDLALRAFEVPLLKINLTLSKVGLDSIMLQQSYFAGEELSKHYLPA